ncbi:MULTISPECIES: hypothetical protein [unclassified Variovorax]|uniref:hypothetical protein n=1 Tax=unclassified Variovorax TaxID=663243 RepID=UPI00076D0211|nr:MULTISPECIES: hypothetical protein [unclassified Variovorax]KWT69539.1 hypothetical protein APY03_6899 [Variovorax sp. WDL1]PNG48856.1 hypothetical protein CHC06_06624 [Variovorax sp. B2]PNG49363.1 hypothetical protein CHC07_06272 [Variovorax sp. B4]VTV18342.1 hypothetical protein WDL1P2_00052 [Variovorax sp. WDL1]
MQTTSTTALDALRQLIATRMASIDDGFAFRNDGSLPYPDGESDSARVLLRQHSMLTDLQEAAAIGVTEVDLGFEGEFDPVEHSLVPEGETAFARNKALHEIALAGIEPIIAAARAAGIAVHAPELELEADAALSEADQPLAGERRGG